MISRLTRQEIYQKLILIIGASMTLFHIICLGFLPMETWAFRIWHMLFAYVLIGLTKSWKTKSEALSTALDLLFIAATVFVCGYMLANLSRLIKTLSFSPTSEDVMICTLGVVLTLLAVYKTNGIVMPLLAVFFMTYTWWGRYIPGVMGTKGYSFSRVMAMCFSKDGVFGTALGVCSTYVIIFIIFGAILEGTGGSKLFIDLSTACFGRYRGGAGKVSITASALMGMISGSAAANAVTTGSFTIPLMRKSGYDPIYSSAVCAVASTGGQIMPPIMGAGAFILAENVGMSYMSVAACAVIPALLYYLSLFLAVDHESVRLKMRGVPREELPKVREVMQTYGHLSISLIVLLVFLIGLRTTAIKAGLYASYTALIVAQLKENTRYNLKQFIKLIASGANAVLGVVAACTCAGIITGVLSLTGLGGKMATLILQLAQGRLLLGLILTMLVCIILGMGLPTTAAFIIGSSVTAPALIQMGLTPLIANMFVFYFSCISAITPPVAIAAYAAAGIADCNPAKAGYKAWWLGLAAFIVPYMFVYSPELLLQSSSVLYIMYCCITACIGVVYFSFFLCGYYFNKKINPVVRAVMLVGSLCLVMSGFYSDAVGVGLIVMCSIYQKLLSRREEKTA